MINNLTSENMVLPREDRMRLLTLGEAALRMFGCRRGRPPCRSTVLQWADPEVGYRPHGNESGEKIFLMTVYINKTYMTLPEWIEEFEDARFRRGQRGNVRTLASVN